VIVDWFNGDATLNVMILQAWKDKIIKLRSLFSFIQVFHIHRTFNSQADKLSKLGLSSSLGVLYVEEYMEEELKTSKTFSLF